MTDSQGQTDEAQGVRFGRGKRKRVIEESSQSLPEADAAPPLSNDLWQRLDLSVPTARVLKRQRIVASRSSIAASQPISMLRTQILQAMKTHEFNTFAVASPTPHCGSSFLAMNLAFSMARQKALRVLLFDVNLREPSLAKRLTVPETTVPLKSFGSNLALPDMAVRLAENLVLAYHSEPVPESSERLQDMSDGGIIAQLHEELRPDVMICDAPPILRSDDLVALSPQLGGVLLVADGTITTPNQVTAAETLLQDRTRLIGIVLNRGKGA